MKGLFGSGLGAQPESQTAPKRNPGTPPSQLNSIASGGPHQYIPRLRGVYWGDIGVSQPARGYYINGWIQFKLPLEDSFPRPTDGKESCSSKVSAERRRFVRGTSPARP